MMALFDWLELNPGMLLVFFTLSMFAALGILCAVRVSRGNWRDE